MCEYIAGFQTENSRLRLSSIRAAQPEDLRCLAFGKGREEAGVIFGSLGGPALVVFKALLESVVCGIYVSSLFADSAEP